MTWANATATTAATITATARTATSPRSTTGSRPHPGKTAYEPKDADWQSFATLAELQKATGQEAHGIEIDYDIFENLTPPDPARRYHVYHSMDLNFRLKPNSKAIDAGVPLPTVNDNFTGQAPDLGALEAESARTALRSPVDYLEALLPVAGVRAPAYCISITTNCNCPARSI